MSGSETKIVKAFAKLLGERPYNKITVKSIVETAHLHRNTFYYHFSDIPALLDYMGNMWIDMVADNINPLDQDYTLEHAFTDFAREHKVQLMNLYHSEAREKLQHVIRNLSGRLAAAYLNTSPCSDIHFTDRDREGLQRLLSGAIAGVLTCWIADGMTYDLGFDFSRYVLLLHNLYTKPEDDRQS